MMILHVFLVAFVISFLGSIPPGMLNVTVMQLAIKDHRRAAAFFALAAVVVEFVYAGLTVRFQLFLYQYPAITDFLMLITGVVLVVLGLVNFYSLTNSKSFLTGTDVRGRSGFKKGLVLAILNPLTVPFWLSVTVYLVSSEWISLDGSLFWAYIIGLSLGTYALLLVVAWLGVRFKQVADNPLIVHKIPGVLFIGMGLYNLYLAYFAF